jgi:UPF0148 protein
MTYTRMRRGIIALTEASMSEMAEMLRKGAKMLSMSCPQCGTPLFQLKTGEIFCPHEKREVKIVKEGETPETMKREATLEQTIQAKLGLLQKLLEASSTPSEIRELTQTINTLLDTLGRLRSKAQAP